jgi:CheY-like chemotaxis protein
VRCPRILLADGAPEVRALLGLALSRAGGDVRAAADGAEALALAQRADAEDAPFDAVLLDAELPAPDAATVATRLRARGCATPILAVTAPGAAGDAERCRRAGCDEVLVRPLPPARVVQALARHLAARAGLVRLDPAALAARGARDGLERLAAAFAEALPERAAALERALADGDGGAVAALAHRLEDTAGAYGFAGVATAAADLHASVAAAGLDRVRDRVARVAELCRRAATARLPL